LAAAKTLLCALLIGSDAPAQPLLSESALAAAFDGVVHAFVPFQDELIVGGTFTHPDGVEVAPSVKLATATPQDRSPAGNTLGTKWAGGWPAVRR